jgi:hypothetical protein
LGHSAGQAEGRADEMVTTRQVESAFADFRVEVANDRTEAVRHALKAAQERRSEADQRFEEYQRAMQQSATSAAQWARTARNSQKELTNALDQLAASRLEGGELACPDSPRILAGMRDSADAARSAITGTNRATGRNAPPPAPADKGERPSPPTVRGSRSAHGRVASLN